MLSIVSLQIGPREGVLRNPTQMAEESQATAAAAEEVVVAEVTQSPMEASTLALTLGTENRPKKLALLAALAAEAAAEAEEKRGFDQAEQEDAKAAGKCSDGDPFKEESNLVADLEDLEKKAFDQLKQLVRAALANHEFSSPPPAAVPAAEKESKEKEVDCALEQLPAAYKNAGAADEDGAKTVRAIEETVVSVAALPPAGAATPPAAPAAEEVLIWGVPLLRDERSDTVLLKFLRARDFKATEAMAMLKNAVLWRAEFGVEALLGEDLGFPEMERVVFTHGVDKAGHPVCYNVYGELQNKELHAMVFADEKKKRRFLRWRIQYLEKGIRDLLDFSPGGVSTMVQVSDLKNSIGPAKDLRAVFALLQDNYPEFVAKQIFVNVPWWYLAFHRMMSPFFTQRTKSKFVFAGPSKTAETLFKYIAPEQVPVRYGGLSQENDPEFTNADLAKEITIKPSTKHSIEIHVTENCLLVWELRVLGWEVTYGAEFVPRSRNGYTVIVQKERRLAAMDEPVVRDSFKIAETGKVVLVVDNATSKRKKLLCRYKTKCTAESI